MQKFEAKIIPLVLWPITEVHLKLSTLPYDEYTRRLLKNALYTCNRKIKRSTSLYNNGNEDQNRLNRVCLSARPCIYWQECKYWGRTDTYCFFLVKVHTLNLRTKRYKRPTNKTVKYKKNLKRWNISEHCSWWNVISE